MEQHTACKTRVFIRISGKASARNIAIDMIRKNNAGKRQAKVVELTKELEECIGDGGLHTHLDKEDIGEMLSHFLETVDKK